MPPFEKKIDEEALYSQWLYWWGQGGTAGKRTAQAFADYSGRPVNTVNKRWSKWKRRATAEGNSIDPLASTASAGKGEEGGLQAHTQPPAQPQEASAQDTPPLPEDADPDTVLRSLLTSPDPAIRLRASVALKKGDVSDDEGGPSPYDGQSEAALLDRMAALGSPELRSQWDARRGAAVLVGELPPLSEGNDLDPDGRGVLGQITAGDAGGA